MSFLLVLKAAMCWTRSGEPKNMPSIHRCCSWRLLFILGTHMQSPRLVHTTSTRIPKVQFARLFVKHTHTRTIKMLLPEMKLCCHDFICFYISFRRRQPCVGLVDQKVCQASFFVYLQLQTACLWSWACTYAHKSAWVQLKEPHYAKILLLELQLVN